MLCYAVLHIWDIKTMICAPLRLRHLYCCLFNANKSFVPFQYFKIIWL